MIKKEIFLSPDHEPTCSEYKRDFSQFEISFESCIECGAKPERYMFTGYVEDIVYDR